MHIRGLVYSLLTLFSATLIAGAAALVWFDFETTLQDVRRSAQSAARAYAMHTSRNLGELRYGVEWLARVVDPQAPDFRVDPSTAETATRLASHMPGLSSLVVVGADARVKFSTMTDAAIGADVSEREYFKAARDRGDIEFIGPAVRAKGTGRNVYTLSRRLEHDGRFAGIVIAGARV